MKPTALVINRKSMFISMENRGEPPPPKKKKILKNPAEAFLGIMLPINVNKCSVHHGTVS